MKTKINKIREKLHNEIGTAKLDKKDIIKISEELDELIIEYYKEEEKKFEE